MSHDGTIEFSDRDAAVRPAFILVMTSCLYFAQGLPLGFVFGAYPTLMRAAGASLGTIAWIPMLGLPWVLKFLWAPLVDTYWLPWMGRRRTWLLTMQAVMIAVMVAIASIVPANDIWLQFALLGFASLASATQDIATDGLAAERLEGTYLGHANALSVGCMTIGFLAGNGGTLIAADYMDRDSAVLLLAGMLALTIIPTLMWSETSNSHAVAVARQNIFATLRKPHALILLALSFSFASAHAIDDALSRFYLVDKG